MLMSCFVNWYTVHEMEMTADTSHVLMSDALRGQVPGLDGDVPAPSAQHVIIIAERMIGDKSTPMVGVLRGVLLGVDPEIEFRCELKEALDVIEAQNLSFGRFELHHAERIVHVPGPFIVKAARIDEISPSDQLCTLGLHLVKPPR